MKKKLKKRYILRKYVYATSLVDAVKKDRKTPVDDCWVDTSYEPDVGGTMGFSPTKVAKK